MSQFPWKYNNSTGCLASRSFVDTRRSMDTDSEVLDAAARIVPRAMREYCSASPEETKSDGTDPGCCRKISASDLNVVPSFAHSAS